MNNLKHIIKNDWEEIKSKIQKNWEKLTDEDLSDINGSYRMLSNRLQKLYGYKASTIEGAIEDFFNSDEFKSFKEKANEKINEIKEVVVSTLDEYFQAAKEKSNRAEKAIADYAGENPIKLIGISAGIGALIGFLCRNK